MILSTNPTGPPSALGIELGLTLIAVAAAFAWPGLGAKTYTRVEHAFGRLAQRRGLALIVVGVSALVLRLAILPFSPIPLPFVPDDFSFLLAADTFLHGRLANPTPAMWIHFESIHITMQPTYSSMYFPAQGLVLAAGKLVFGHPWFGLLITSAFMCAGICWMLQAWMPARWALLGGFIAIVHIGLFSYWINTYHAAGTITAFGGALILGALPRLMKKPLLRYSLLMAAGTVILGLSRPYECVLLYIPVSVVMVRWLIVGKNRPAPRALFRLAAAPVLLVVAGAAWMGYYDYRAFGSPTILPYTISRNTYAMAPYFIWQKPRLGIAYNHPAMQNYYQTEEMDLYQRLHSAQGFIPVTLVKPLAAMLFFGGFAFFPLIFMLRRVLFDRRIRFLIVCVAVLMAGMLIENFLVLHYLASYTAAFYAIGLQAMRHMRIWTLGDRPVGLALVRFTLTVCLFMACLRLYAGPLHLPIQEWPPTWNISWYGPDHFGTERDRIETALEQTPGKQLVIVRYSATHTPFDEWVYNSADIDNSKVVWAREMDAASNLQLINYYRDRKVWLVQPDSLPATVSAYPLPAPSTVESHSGE